MRLERPLYHVYRSLTKYMIGRSWPPFAIAGRPAKPITLFRHECLITRRGKNLIGSFHRRTSSRTRGLKPFYDGGPLR
jgi:hypothetical protein